MRIASGTIRLCSLANVGGTGRAPSEKLSTVDIASYEERALGYNRVYAAMGAGHTAERLVRTWPIDARPGMYVVTEDGAQWRIDVVQRLTNEDGLPCMDLTLARQGVLYGVLPE